MNKFKKIFLVFILFAALLNFSVIFSGALDISAQSGILICADSGSVIWSKNETEPLPMASTTKIMTSLLALEHMEACGNKEIEITEEMVRVEGTSMGLRAGNIVNLEALVQGMLLCSGNDAANAAAIAVGGDVNNFIDLMNEKAKMIGMENTKFSTPSGLDKDNHHSTAKDMAILGAYAMENENFLKITSQKSMPVKFLSPNKTVRLKNHNKLLRLYDGCIGVKTGFTKLAGRCLVSCAEKNGVRLICVTLNAPNDWDDHMSLYNFGFENTVLKKFCDVGFKISVPLKNSSEGNLECECNSEFSAVFKKGDELKITRQVEIPDVLELPIERGQILGKVVYYLDGKIVGKNDILSSREVKKIKVKKYGFFYGIADFFRKLLGGK
ncbi:MAG: D-alanyl-D-alanine carboxypeptidase [Clostridia bacterium]|nr:D-alanyl-D-alanine carboxypeptidase [Clostridia bacterium]